ncbi:MAG: FAD-dependent oxidoreductase [Candidatus Micrarchaeia archaeon]
MENFDIAVIGGGPAGVTAAIYTQRNNLSTVVFEHKLIGGAISTTTAVENAPGFNSIQGPDLGAKYEQQLDFLKVAKKFDSVTGIKKVEKGFELSCESGSAYFAKAVILATGSEYRKLGIPGEDAFKGRGISFCATCDAPFFKNKDVIVIGGGNTALTSALLLSEHCKTVKLVHRRAEFRGEAVLVQQLKDKKVEFVLNKAPVEIKGDKFVTSVEVEDVNTKEKSSLPAQGIFINVGFEPLNSLAKQLGAELTPAGFVKRNEAMETNVAGFFAAGDITGGMANVKQIVTSEAEGCVAAASAYAYVKKASMSDINY